MKGIVVFYIDVRPEQEVHQTMNTVITANRDVIKKINSETGYQVLVIPTMNEICRIERINFDKPFTIFNKAI